MEHSILQFPRKRLYTRPILDLFLCILIFNHLWSIKQMKDSVDNDGFQTITTTDQIVSRWVALETGSSLDLLGTNEEMNIK